MEPYCVIRHAQGGEILPMHWQDNIFFGKSDNYSDKRWHGMWLVNGPDTLLNEQINGSVVERGRRGRIDFKGHDAQWDIVGNPLAK